MAAVCSNGLLSAALWPAWLDGLRFGWFFLPNLPWPLPACCRHKHFRLVRKLGRGSFATV